MERLTIWIGALATLAMWSQLYKENPFYRLAEHSMIGVTIGHSIVMAGRVIEANGIRPIVDGSRPIAVVPFILGLLFFLRFTKQYRYLARIPGSLLIGLSMGLIARTAIETDLFQQVVASWRPVDNINTVVILLGVLTTITYFFFTVGLQRAGGSSPLSVASQMGRYTMMVTFGGSFGNAVMARNSVLISQVQFLLRDWLGVIQ